MQALTDSNLRTNSQDKNIIVWKFALIETIY